MYSPESISYFAAISICGFCLALLLKVRSHLKNLSPVFVWLIVVYTAGFVIQLLLQSPQSYWKHLWFFLAVAHSFLIGPVVWLYAMHICGESARFRTLSRFKIAMIVTGVACAAPLLVLVRNNAGWSPRSNPFPFFWELYYTLATVYVVIYFVQASLYITSCQRMIRDKNTDVDNSVLRFLLMGYIAAVAINTARVIFCAFVAPDATVNVVLSIGDIAVSVCLIFFIIVKILQGDTPSKKIKYEHSILDDILRKSIKTKIEMSIRQPEVFTNNGLTLTEFSKGIGEKHHYVSQVINQDMQMTFLELLNSARIDHAKNLLRSEASLTMIDLAEIVGFNSKTTFYSAFSKYVGMTPAKFKSGS